LSYIQSRSFLVRILSGKHKIHDHEKSFHHRQHKRTRKNPLRW